MHPSFAGVVLHFVYENDTFDLKGTFDLLFNAKLVLFELYFMTRTGIQTIHFVGKKDDILGWAKQLD